MAYDEQLAARVRGVLGARSGVSERRMFGGLAFMVGDHMGCAVGGDGRLMVRVPREDLDRLLLEPGVGPMEMSGRRMGGFVLVDESQLADDADLARWVDAGADLASSLPPK